ncbi:MAG: aldo/keto reductase [Caldilineaceae bacterium]|nr:aldo/keto reductase [Caldilineaceae bacterium]
METRTFGNSDLVTSVIGFGTWEMSTTMYGHIDVEEASRAVRAAIDHGITLFDTAEIYGPFHSEEILGKALGERRKEIVLVTKVGFNYDENGKNIGRNSKPEYVIERTEGCLKRLNTDVIDLMLIHWPDHNTPIADTIPALEKLKADGKIRYYGVSNFTVPMMEECERHGHLTANQVGYHMFDRRMESAVLPYCQEHGIGYMAYGTLGFGLLTGAFTPDTTFVDWDWRSKGNAFGLPLFQREEFLKELRVVDRLKRFAADHGRSVAQLAIAWTLSHPAVTVGLVGMRNERELAENVRATDWKLTAADKAEIDNIFAEEGVPTYVDAAQAV